MPETASIHPHAHPHAGHTVTIRPRGCAETHEFELEDWWDRVHGTPWGQCDGNPAAIQYAIRAGNKKIPPDNEVVYGKIKGAGHLVHESEIVGRS